jgi:hypothetical protein
MKQTVFVTVLLVLACSSANAALQSRAGGQAYYDTDTDLTWVADANLAKTSGFDADGLMDFSEVFLVWIPSLNAQNAGQGYLGKNDWRLPTVTDTGFLGCDFAYTGTDCGYNVDPATGEMARMHYSTLGNTASFNTLGVQQPCATAAPNFCLTNTGPFSNLQPAGYYAVPDSGFEIGGWRFLFNRGFQNYQGTWPQYYAWPVRTGDFDSDGDGALDHDDNCMLVANASQCDSDGDGYGNRCDGDLNDNGAVNAQDTTLYRQQLGQPSAAPSYNEADLNCNGNVNAQDTTLFRQLLGSPPGPSGLVP